MATAASYEAGSGEPMVLLHGFTNSWRTWAAILPALEAHHAVVALTLPGHHGGRSFEGAPVSIDAMVDIVERQMDERGIDRAHLIGNSLGGWLGLELALRDRALSVVGICPAGGWECGGPEERRLARFFWRNNMALQIARPWLRTIAGRPRMRAIAYRDLVARPSRSNASNALAGLEAASGCTIVDEMLALLRTGELFGELGSVTCPVRIATGTEDRLFNGPRYYSKLRRLQPDADWIVLEGLGHIPMTDDPARVAEAILEVSRKGRRDEGVLSSGS